MSRASHPPLPDSDVSSRVGLVGLIGLAAWLMVCRHWPAIAIQLGLSGPQPVLSGPGAALVALLCAALPMVLVSLLVDKVHLRPSTGLDWHRPRTLRASWPLTVTKLVGLWSTWGLIGFAYCLGRWYFRGNYLFAMQLLWQLLPLLLLLSVPYVLWLDRTLREPRDGAWHFGALLLGYPDADRAAVVVHARSWAVKGFFTAFMLAIVPGGWARMVTFDWSRAAGDPVALASGLIELMFLVDVQIGTVGYLMTLRPLDAHIRSANPLLAGWVAALLCYPPLSLMLGGNVLDYRVNGAEWSYWLAGNPVLLWGWGALLVLLTAAYAWATVAFGLRFSNLSWRGVLTNGPYRFTRHPAYLAKNTFWWLASLPMLATSHSPVDAIRNTALLALVSALYYWRARTEEAHLLAEDPKYVAYHAWMAQHGAITARLGRLGQRLSGVRPEAVPQPAE